MGCGHGLLLDEARRRGYEVTGIELSTGAAEYAREVLELDVLEQPLEGFAADSTTARSGGGARRRARTPGRPGRGAKRLRAAACPGGALCVITPDPSSATARLAGRRWWAYVPAHTFLLPRATLRELLEARGS